MTLAHEAVGARAHRRQPPEAEPVTGLQRGRIGHAQADLLQAALRQRMHQLEQRRRLLCVAPLAPHRANPCNRSVSVAATIPQRCK